MREEASNGTVVLFISSLVSTGLWPGHSFIFLSETLYNANLRCLEREVPLYDLLVLTSSQTGEWKLLGGVPSPSGSPVSRADSWVQTE